MGMEIQVNSLEDMCALMCDNVIPKRSKRMKLIIDIDEYDLEWIRNGYCIPLELNEKMTEMIINGTPLDDIKAELKARLWRWRGKTNLNIDKVAMETIINEVFDEE